jgi:hypothetical protein
MKGALGMEVP